MSYLYGYLTRPVIRGLNPLLFIRIKSISRQDSSLYIPASMKLIIDRIDDENLVDWTIEEKIPRQALRKKTPNEIVLYQANLFDANRLGINVTNEVLFMSGVLVSSGRSMCLWSADCCGDGIISLIRDHTVRWRTENNAKRNFSFINLPKLLIIKSAVYTKTFSFSLFFWNGSFWSQLSTDQFWL